MIGWVIVLILVSIIVALLGYLVCKNKYIKFLEDRLDDNFRNATRANSCIYRNMMLQEILKESLNWIKCHYRNMGKLDEFENDWEDELKLLEDRNEYN